ncbi:hypothetical protein KUTeg_000618 [Tegillarca granosa]|uniref:Transposase Helix-turn-helix domain-containing protein n=1 Tax=Tegillarca granosa TaxID=220873 RepID=A0ABQ9FY17_TEGGR|nr:hypothetical protein KUTeg_000618 [Tegillarca granosa]
MDQEYMAVEFFFLSKGDNCNWFDDKLLQFILPCNFLTFYYFSTCNSSFLLPKAQNMRYWNGSSTPEFDRQRPLQTCVPLIDQFLAVLMRLKVGLFVHDIADRFLISTSTFSNIFVTWICLMYEELSIINRYPSRDLVNQTMPSSFKKFKNLRVILDCTEIYIQRPSNLITQNLTFSNYKTA